MSEDEIFEIPKPKKERKKKVLTEERKEQLREQLKKAREVRRMNKSKQTKKKEIDVSEKMETETIIESDTEPQTTTEDVKLEDLGDEEQEILNIQLDIEEMNNKLNKKKKRTVQQKKGVIIKQRQTINDIVEKKVRAGAAILFLLNSILIICNPAVALEHAIAYLQLRVLQIALSNFFKLFPWVIKSCLRERLTELMSDLSINCLL